MSEIATEIKPTQSASLFNGAVTAHAFGLATGNWRIGDHTKPENFMRVTALAKQFEVSTVWCPKASDFNAKITQPSDFGPHSPCDFDYQFEIDGIKVMRGALASGCAVGKGEAFFMATADCPIMVVRNGVGKIVCAHAGRDELIDRRLIMYGYSSGGRRFESVVDAIANYFGAEIQYLEVASVFGARHGFVHSVKNLTYGDFNLSLRQYIMNRWGTRIQCFNIDEELLIQELIRLQWRSRHSVASDRIWEDKVCTKTDIDDKNNFLWHSVARGNNQGERNGIFVVVNK